MDQSKPPPSSSSKPSPPADVPHIIPGPWLFQSKVYLFAKVLSPGDSREDSVLQGLPPGSYHPSETVHPSALTPVNDAPQWKGGLSYFALVRYEDTPVGPYDELIALSDGWANPYEDFTSMRITNIYVDSRKSLLNGRHNWNIPKHLARFEINSTGSRTSTFKAFLPTEEKPFFAAKVTDSYLPGVPLPGFLLNSLMRMVQPPIEGTSIDESNNDWLTMIPTYRGRWQVAYIQPTEAELENYGDGLHFPRFQPWWVGAKFTGTIYFPAGEKINSRVE